MVDTVNEFLIESREGLEQLTLDLVSLEENPDCTETLSSVFRTIHTIKGGCGFLGYPTLEQITHVGEDLLGKVREGACPLDGEINTLLLELADAVGELLDTIASTGTDAGDYGLLIAKLEARVLTLDSGDRESDDGTTTTQDVAISTNITDSTSTSSIEKEDYEDDDLEELSPVIDLDEEMQEVLKDFLQESFENLDQVDSELIELEEHPDNRDLLSSIFRTMHTIKGTCGFFGFEKLEKVTHIGENLLVKLRDGEYSISEEIATGLLGMVDAVRGMLQEIADHGHDGHKGYRRLLGVLSELNEHGKLVSAVDVEPVSKSKVVQLPETEDKPADPANIRSITVAGNAKQSASAANNPSAALDKVSPNVVEPSIRVDVPVLDALMNLVGELVLARNQIVEYVGVHENSQVVAAAQRLNLITSELQEGVMQTRMQPIHSVWAKLPRVVRDLSRACGKQIRVEMEGKSTELDKSLIEAMKDPITHLVRNSVDHGIESPETRLAAGKPAEGVLRLRAFHEGGQVHIEISDDGGGIKAENIKKKAIESGVVTREQAEAMTDQEACKMIFLPGLSTAEAVTNISGRGVGMDVVKTNIEKISGAIDLDTEVGSGTVFKIRVPLTLAIVPALIVSTGDQRYAIPQVNLIELIRIDEEDQHSAIEHIHGCPVYRLRGELLPLVHLDKELMLESSEQGVLNIVVLQAEKRRFGLVVDQISDTQEIVVKPLAEALKNIPVFAGATIMGDGRVALILDTMGIGLRAKVLGAKADRTISKLTKDESENSGHSETLLLVNTASNGKLAIPLNRVARLEQFEIKDTEFTGDVQVVQYRGQILPLVQLSEFLDERRKTVETEEDPDVIQVVVFGREGSQIGLVVKEIVDVVDEVIEIRGKSSRKGVLGTASIQGQVTELLDVSSFIESTSDMVIDMEEAA